MEEGIRPEWVKWIKYTNSYQYKIKVKMFYFFYPLKAFLRKMGLKLKYGFSYREIDTPEHE